MRWLLTTLNRADPLTEEIANHDYAPVRRSEVLEAVDCNRPLALLGLVITRGALPILVGANDRVGGPQGPEPVVRVML